MTIAGEKLYTEPGSGEEQILERDEQRARSRRSNNETPRRNTTNNKKRTGAKKSNGKKVALTLLVVGGLVAGSIFGTKAYYSHQETKRVDNLIAAYTTDDYVVVPSPVISNRAYDITYADGEKIVRELEESNINFININGNYYTKDGIDIAVINYEVTYPSFVNATKVNAEGEAIYMAPKGYTLNGKQAYTFDNKFETKVVPVNDDYSYIRFEGASDWRMIGEPLIVHTLPYDVIKNSTLICDVPDGATLNENNECIATLDLAPKKR